MKALTKRTEASPYHRYLKPGALAQLRDSRISARSSKISVSDSLSRSFEYPVRPQVAAAAMDLVPQFISHRFGPRHLKRKKLMAARSVNWPSLEPASSVSSLNLINGDAVATH
ncbi:hypothetical protein SAY86_006075 [Trapa natans]|uniref:Uncharacterized protein n=1 Tax=Trapa natans TaxID=22666 RepID=A0AAN7QU02_TRANT|nr:hypothetical protein SAY86_006075 [Trapa natans]